MIERLNAAPLSFRGTEIKSPRETFQAVVDNNEKIQKEQNALMQGQKIEQQGQKLDTVA